MGDEIPTKFVSKPSNSLYCPLCRKLFCDPVISITCGHTFCRPCLEANNGMRTTFSCPVDQKPVDIDNLVPNRALQGQLEDLLIYCRHALHRVDSQEDFELDDDGCKEHITLGTRSEHEDTCPSAWTPCPNSSNNCGLFRRMDLQQHLTECAYFKCRHCEYRGTITEVEQHAEDCSNEAATIVDWDGLEAITGDNVGDGLHSKHIVKALKNLNKRVTSLEDFKQDMLASVERCNNNVLNLSSQMEKLMQTVEQIRITQNAMMRDRYCAQSASDLGGLIDRGQRATSVYGLRMYGSARERSQSSGLTGMFGFAEPKYESWKMPLSFKCVGTFRGHGDVIRTLAAQGPYLYSAGADHLIKVWDIKDKDMKNSKGCVATLSSHTGDIHGLCTTGGFLYSAGTDKSIKVWSIETFELQDTKKDAHADIISAIATTGDHIFSGSYSSIKVWSVVNLELVKNVTDIHHWVRAIAVDPKKEKVYSGSHNTVHIWEASQPFASVGCLDHTHGSVYSVAVTSLYLILGTYNQNTHIYDVNTHQHIKVLNGHIGIINDLVTSPSGNFLFTASFDHTIQLWDMVKMLPIQIFSRHEGSVNCMALRGDKLFTGSDDEEIKVYLYYQGLASKNLMVV